MTIETTYPPAHIAAVPAEVAEAYQLDPARIAKLGGGLVNLTFAADGPAGRLALQRLAPETPVAAIEDFAVYTDHLRKTGWRVPGLRQTVSGQNFVYDQDGRLWRGMDYVPSDDRVPADTASDQFLQATGSLLGQWHHTMSGLAYQPHYELTRLHDSEYHMQKLEETASGLPNNACRLLARQTLRAFARLEPLPEEPQQFIHADPKLANMLYENGQPFTLIDFDTVMQGPVWHDIGDLLRSVLKDNLQTARPSADIVQAISTSYFETVRPNSDLPEFIDTATLATRHITLELLARYLNDIVEGSYFTWDETRFDSRASNHLSRARDQWQVFQQLQAKE